MLNINQLKTFVTVVEEQSISSAAEKLSLTQPAVSLHIQGLEDFVGTSIFTRRGRVIELSGAGEILLEKAKDFLEHYESTQKSIIEEIDGIKKDVIIGAGPIMSDYVLPHVLAPFIKMHPSADIQIEASETSLIVKGVLDHTFDLGFTGAPVANDKIEEEEWIEEELLLIVPPNHPFAELRSLKIKDLEGQNFVFRKHITGIHMFLENKLEIAGINRSVLSPSFEVPSIASVLSSVEAGVGISFVPRWVVKQALELKTVINIPIEDVSLVRHLYIISRKHKRKFTLIKELINHLRAYKNLLV